MTNNWQSVQLGNIVSIRTGHKNANAQSANGIYPFFTCAQDISRIDSYTFDCEAVLVAGNGDFNVKYYKGKFDAYQRTYVFEGKDSIKNKFLYYLLQNYLPEVTSNARGSTIQYLKINDFIDFKFNLPDISIQDKVINILDTLSETIQKTDQIILKKKELKKGMLDQLTNTDNGKSIKLEDVIKIKNGFAYSGKNMVDSETNTVILTPGNVEIGGGFNFSKLRYYSGEVIRDYVLKPGDIFVALTDLTPQANFLGYPAIVPDLKNKTFLHNQRLGLIQLTSANVDLIFIYFLLMTFNYRQHVVSTASGTTVKHTSVPKIIDYKFDLPTLDVQKKMVEKLRLIEHDLKTEKETKDFYCELKKGLMHDIFSQKVQI